MQSRSEGLGRQPFHGRIVVLIKEHTHSAAEMVTSFAKQNRLATLAGTRTAGEVSVARISNWLAATSSACLSRVGTHGKVRVLRARELSRMFCRKLC
jgi:C-terminal processing protease CtpA/Prc